jgi:signal transduction histidine kinase
MSDAARSSRVGRAGVPPRARPVPVQAGARPVEVPATEIDELEFDRAKSSFLAAMGHELRTPLNAIIGFSEMMSSETFGPLPSARYLNYVEHILGSAQYLRQIIEDVLEISRAEAGTLVLNRSEVDLATLIGQACREFEARCRSRAIALSVDVPEDVVVKVDPTKIGRAISCLLSNAVKFNADGGSIQVTARLGDKGCVTIRIADDGIGIDPSEIDLAFRPFVQLEDKLSRRFDGSGLGLPLARLLVELHGGTVSLESRVDAGTTATMVLPAYSTALANGRRH